MSTFNGFISEFEHIRIDRFRPLPGKPPPLACFLSHVHSDHLVGLESFRSPFVYCSAATRELVLHLEKFPHRMNFAKGILEWRKQTYKHLSRILRPLPLDCPTQIQLSPGNTIQVTLLDANHCVGAVMFLIEGGGKSILYTGDIRAEPWWIENLLRNPSFIRYVAPRHLLDKVYLDTTFATRHGSYREFPPKSEGIRELLVKLRQYPPTTTFVFNAWTFGYEDVWRAMSKELCSQIHLDQYRYRLYTSIGNNNRTILAHEAAALCGFSFGNDYQAGILTRDEAVRIHSCEKWTDCQGLKDGGSDIVFITPIVSRFNGLDMHEFGTGGGKGDLDQIHELEIVGPAEVQKLLSICTSAIQDPCLMNQVVSVLKQTVVGQVSRLQLESLKDLASQESDKILLEQIPLLIAHHVRQLQSNPSTREMISRSDRVLIRNEYVSRINEERIKQIDDTNVDTEKRNKDSTKHDRDEASSTTLPKTLTFPYSRHSSYTELRDLISALRPRDIWPCTAPPANEWTEDSSMQSLFGDLCSNEDRDFAYDRVMRSLQASKTSCTTQRMVTKAKIKMKPVQKSAESVQEEMKPNASIEQSGSVDARCSSLIDLTNSQEMVVRIDDKFADAIPDPKATANSKQKRHLHLLKLPSPTTKQSLKRPVSPPALKRYQSRKIAYDAASSGEWGQSIQLECTDVKLGLDLGFDFGQDTKREL